jgi:3-methyladenine DNA glycosylase AlkD
MNARLVQGRLRALGNPASAAFLARFFKTGPGEYAEGDVLIGVRVPAIRNVVREFKDLPLRETARLLRSRIHEERLAALIVLVSQARKGCDEQRKRIYDLYLANTRHVNNWDLVDLSAPQLVGAFLEDKNRKPLYRLAMSSWLWDRRISILATFHFIRQGDFCDTLAIGEKLLGDREDLIHKATRWMLREVGKRDPGSLTAFLDEKWRAMPRTMLRYAIERLPAKMRRAYLSRR